MNDSWGDARWASRLLWKNPGFTAAAVATLALGIGLNAALFSMSWGVLLQPLPFAEPERTVKLYSVTPEGNLGSFSYPDVRDLREGSGVFSEVATSEIFGVALLRQQESRALWSELVSGNFFEALPVHAALGRVFGPEVETSPEAAAVVVLEHRAWQLHFGADPGIVGRTVTLNHQDFTVVGVTPPAFRGVFSSWFSPDLWIPLAAHEQLDPRRRGLLEARGERLATSLARLAPGASVAQAQARLDALTRALAASYPETHARQRGRALAETDTRPEADMAPGTRAAMLVFHALAMLVLLVSSANVANLLLARAAARRREIAVRVAVGAARGRLVRQLLIESLMLAALAGAVGSGMAWLLVSWLGNFQMPSHFPLRVEIGVEWHSLAFSIGLSTLTALGFGLLPALQASRPDVVSALKGESGRGGGVRSRLMNGLVVAQVAVSLVLLVVGGLFLRSMQAAGTLELGFDPDRLVLADVNLDRPGIETPGWQEQRMLELQAGVAALPGVVAASLAAPVPLEFWFELGRVFVGGRQLAAEEEPGLVTLWSRVGPGYFDVMRTPIERGRGFEASDDASARPVAVVNRAMAEQLWPGQDPIGRTLRLDAADAVEVAVVGVAANGKYNTLFEPERTFLFTPLLQPWSGPATSAGTRSLTLVARTTGDPLALAPAVRTKIRALDPELPVLGIKSMEQLIEGRSFMLFRLGAGFGVVMGLVALTLAVVGLYSVVSLAVARRTHEIGVRMAIGAQPGQVLRLILTQGMRLVGLGAVLGGLAALAVGRLTAGLLIGVGPDDPLTLGCVAALLAAVAALAALLPARRAARVDPMAALRSE